jgi:hypothetical protein
MIGDAGYGAETSIEAATQDLSRDDARHPGDCVHAEVEGALEDAGLVR